MAEAPSLNDPQRVDAIRRCIRGKPALVRWYREGYAKWAEGLSRCPADGVVLELGSGAGFAREVVPDLVTSDVLPYEGVDRVVDATALPFGDGTLRAILGLNVFHHIEDVSAFLREAERCLAVGGRVFLIDQHVGWISRPILAHAHHEPFDAETRDWSFASEGPLSSANGALAWIVFERDRERFAREHPGLRLERYAPHSPLRYFWCGGLRPWSLLPGFAFPLATALDRALVALSPRFGSFVDVELVRV
ncbi:MAG: methyltransferase domain-containing protein [Myxococcota bacterium]